MGMLQHHRKEAATSWLPKQARSCYRSPCLPFPPPGRGGGRFALREADSVHKSCTAIITRLPWTPEALFLNMNPLQVVCMRHLVWVILGWGHQSCTHAWRWKVGPRVGIATWWVDCSCTNFVTSHMTSSCGYPIIKTWKVRTCKMWQGEPFSISETCDLVLFWTKIRPTLEGRVCEQLWCSLFCLFQKIKWGS